MKSSDTSPWLDGDLNDWRDLVTGLMPVLFKKNAVIFQPGDEARNLYIVKSGRVRITCYQLSGVEKQLYIARPGAVFGESSCFSKTHYTATAIAIVDVRVFCVECGDAARKMTQNWPLTKCFIRAICRKEALLQKQVLELSFADSAQRVAQILLNLADAYGEQTPDGFRINIRFTQQDVANLAKTSRVTISNTFRKFYKQNLMARKNSLFHLKDIDAMRRIAGMPNAGH